MLRIFILLAALLPNFAIAGVLDHIKRVAPHLSDDTSARYYKVIKRESARHNLDPRVVVAIVAQESSFRVVSTKRQVIDPVLGLIEVDFDLGIMQLNVGTANQYGFDLKRLQRDAEYGLRSGIKVLADKIAMCSELYPETPWGCYHSSTLKYHERYIQHVRRWL